MSFRNTNFFIFVTLLEIIVNITALKCAVETSCSCQLDNGTFYDLEKLSAEGLLNLMTPNYTFAFQPCKNVKMDLDSNKMTECNNSTGVTLCAAKKGGSTFSLGNTTETKWVFNNTPELELKHANYTAHIALICCPETTCKTSSLIWNFVTNETDFHFILNSPHSCGLQKAKSHEGISTGSLLVILLFVFSAVYLGVGALTLKLRRGARGLELIPNYDFWSEIPGLFRDGVTYIFSGCSTSTYLQI